MNLYIDQEKHKLDKVAARNKNVSRQTYRFLKVKLRRFRRKAHEDKYNICDKNLPTVLLDSSNHSQARRNNVECK